MIRNAFVAAGMASLALFTAGTQAEPTRTFAQETAEVAFAGDVFVDLYDTNANTLNQIRVGAFNGEVLITPGFAFPGVGALGSSLGYKASLGEALAVFGALHLDTATGGTNAFQIGAAYTMRQDELLLNAQPLLNIDENDTAFSIEGAAFYGLPVDAKLGRLSVGGELGFTTADLSDFRLDAGLRWVPKDEITIDMIFLQKVYTETADVELQTPAGLRLNVQF